MSAQSEQEGRTPIFIVTKDWPELVNAASQGELYDESDFRPVQEEANDHQQQTNP